MNVNNQFLAATLNTLADHIAVIDRQGKILYVNKSWCLFALENNAVNPNHWLGENYLEACDAPAIDGGDSGVEAADGIRSVINGEKKTFYHEYPCNSPIHRRWFLMRVVTFEVKREIFIVISHSDITERKLSEEQVVQLSRIDSLTGLANRRYFEEWYAAQWARSVREQTPLTLALIDIDHFKLLNDSFGHAKGDDCLKAISEVLLTVARRPDDVCVRYGGDELLIVYGNTQLHGGLKLLGEFVGHINQLAIPNPVSPTGPVVTLSIGVAMIYPDKDKDPHDLVRFADSLLYRAKDTGRNRIESAVVGE